MKKFTILNKPGYYAVRTPGRGTGKTYKPDLLVVEDGELYAIEVKSTNRASKYVRPDQLARLLRFAELFRIKCPTAAESSTPNQSSQSGFWEEAGFSARWTPRGPSKSR